MAWVVIGLTVAAMVGFLWLAARVAMAGQGERRAALAGRMRLLGRRAVALRRPEGSALREGAGVPGAGQAVPEEGHAAEGDEAAVDRPERETARPDPTVTIARQLGAAGGASTMGGPVFPFRTTADREREGEGEAEAGSAESWTDAAQRDRP